MRAQLPKNEARKIRPGDLTPPAETGENGVSTVAGIPLDDVSFPPGFEGATATFIQPGSEEPIVLDVADASEETIEPESGHTESSDLFRFLVRLGEIDDEEVPALPLPLADAGLIDFKNTLIKLRLPKELGKRFLIQYSADGANWETLGEHQAGVFVDHDKARVDEHLGYYLVSVLEVANTAKSEAE